MREGINIEESIVFDNREDDEVSLSIIIPTYNGADTIEKCLESVLSQTFEDFEIIIIDDGSSDGINEIISNFFHKSDVEASVLYIQHEENVGLGSTLNEAMQRSRGENFFIIHQDCELIENTYLDKLVETAGEKTDAGIVTGKRTYKNEDLGPMERIYLIINGRREDPEKNSTKELNFSELKCDFVSGDLAREIGGFASDKFRTSGEDQYFSWNIRKRNKKIVQRNDSPYLQKIGGAASSIASLLKKVALYGKTQSGIVYHSKGGILRGENGENKFSDRLKNRVQMWLVGLMTLFCLPIGFALSAEWLIYFIFGILIIRYSQYLLKGVTFQSEMSIKNSVKLGIIGLLSDFTYTLALVYGFMALALSRKL